MLRLFALLLTCAAWFQPPSPKPTPRVICRSRRRRRPTSPPEPMSSVFGQAIRRHLRTESESAPIASFPVEWFIRSRHWQYENSCDQVHIRRRADALITQPAETFVPTRCGDLRQSADRLWRRAESDRLQFNFRRGHNGSRSQIRMADSIFCTAGSRYRLSQYNFTFSFGGGVQVFSGERSSFSLGYRYYHLSNAIHW